MIAAGFISGSSVVQTPSSRSSVRSSRIHSLGMWKASRRSARLTLRSRRSSRLPRLFSGSNFRSLSEKPSADICTRILSWKYWTIRSNDLGVGAPRDEPHLLHGGDDADRVARDRALDERHHPAAHRLAHGGGRAEVEEHDGGRPAGRRRRLHQQVPGVRIGVIEAVDEDLLAVGLDADARGGAAIDVQAARAARGRRP